MAYHQIILKENFERIIVKFQFASKSMSFLAMTKASLDYNVAVHSNALGANL